MKALNIGLIDYGIGNIKSVENALEHLGHHITKIASEESFEKFDVVVLPGVGEFGAALNSLSERSLLEPIAKYLNTGSPFLGICVGLQILFEGSDESPDTKGLGYFSGRLSDLANMNLGVPVPSVGWQKIISDKREAPKLDEAYLVHQFFVTGHSVEEMYSHYFYGDLQIPTHIGRGPVQGVQFHPEKSGERGLKFLQEVLASLVIGKTK